MRRLASSAPCFLSSIRGDRSAQLAFLALAHVRHTFQRRAQPVNKAALLFCVSDAVLMAGAEGLEPSTYGFGDRQLALLLCAKKRQTVCCRLFFELPLSKHFEGFLSCRCQVGANSRLEKGLEGNRPGLTFGLDAVSILVECSRYSGVP